MPYSDDTTPSMAQGDTEDDRIQILNGTERLSYFVSNGSRDSTIPTADDSSLRIRLARLLRLE
jgi:hypothetical protein